MSFNFPYKMRTTVTCPTDVYNLTRSFNSIGLDQIEYDIKWYSIENNAHITDWLGINQNETSWYLLSYVQDQMKRHFELLFSNISIYQYDYKTMQKSNRRLKDEIIYTVNTWKNHYEMDIC